MGAQKGLGGFHPLPRCKALHLGISLECKVLHLGISLECKALHLGIPLECKALHLGIFLECKALPCVMKFDTDFTFKETRILVI